MISIEENKRYDAEQYIDKAQVAIVNENYKKAERLLIKSELLYPSEVIAALLNEVREKMESGTQRTRQRHSTFNQNQTLVENNRENADLCYDKALEAYNRGEFKRAEKLLIKSERMCSSVRCRRLLQQVQKKTQTVLETDDEEVKKPKPIIMSKEQKKPEVPRVPLPPTQEQLQAIQRVCQGKNDRDKLGVSAGASQTEVKRAYRRLTLLLHPDKNKAPGAQEAFMMVTEAADRLKKNSRN